MSEKITMSGDDIKECFGDRFYYELLIFNEIEEFIPDIRSQYIKHLADKALRLMKDIS